MAAPPLGARAAWGSPGGKTGGSSPYSDEYRQPSTRSEAVPPLQGLASGTVRGDVVTSAQGYRPARQEDRGSATARLHNGRDYPQGSFCFSNSVCPCLVVFALLTSRAVFSLRNMAVLFTLLKATNNSFHHSIDICRPIRWRIWWCSTCLCACRGQRWRQARWRFTYARWPSRHQRCSHEHLGCGAPRGFGW